MNNNNEEISIIRILFLSADPTVASRLRLGQELRDIREQLQLSRNRNRLFLESRECVRPHDTGLAGGRVVMDTVGEIFLNILDCRWNDNIAVFRSAKLSFQ